jgi:hypothetical protein
MGADEEKKEEEEEDDEKKEEDDEKKEEDDEKKEEEEEENPDDDCSIEKSPETRGSRGTMSEARPRRNIQLHRLLDRLSRESRTLEDSSSGWTRKPSSIGE